MEVRKRGLFSSTQLLAGSASGESTRRLLSPEGSGWPLLNVRPWIGWTRKLLDFFLTGLGLNQSLGIEVEFSSGQMVRNQ